MAFDRIKHYFIHRSGHFGYLMTDSYNNIRLKTEQDGQEIQKDYYVVDYYPSSSTFHLRAVSDYGIPINRLATNIDNSLGYKIRFDRQLSPYAGNTTGTGVIQPGEYPTNIDVDELAENDTFPVVSYGDKIRIRITGGTGYNGALIYVPGTGNPYPICFLSNGEVDSYIAGRMTGSDDKCLVLEGATVDSDGWFTVDRSLMEYQTVRRNEYMNNNLLQSNPYKQYILQMEPIVYNITFKFGYGLNKFYYRIKRSDGTVYQDWAPVHIVYVTMGATEGMRMMPTNQTISVPYGYKVEIYGSTKSGYILSENMAGHTSADNPYVYTVDEDDTFEVSVTTDYRDFDIDATADGVDRVYYRKAGTTSWSSTAYTTTLRSVTVGDVYEFYTTYTSGYMAPYGRFSESSSSPTSITVTTDFDQGYTAYAAQIDNSVVGFHTTLTRTGNFFTERLYVDVGVQNSVTLNSLRLAVILAPSSVAGTMITSGHAWTTFAEERILPTVYTHTGYLYYTKQGVNNKYFVAEGTIQGNFDDGGTNATPGL